MGVCVGVPYQHIRHQGAVLAALGRVALAAVTQGKGGQSEHQGPPPDTVVHAVVPPRDDALIDDFIRWAGGKPSAWREHVPPTLFPQWGFPVLGDALKGVNYPLAKVLNGGCRIETYRPIPRGMPLHLAGCIDHIDDNGRRAVLSQKLVTSSPEGEVLQVAHVYGIVPLKREKKEGAAKVRKTPKVVSIDARPIGDWKIPANAGLSFACLTGDFNPIHWLSPYAKAAGFGRTILHGFGTLAGALERIRNNAWAGDTRLPEVLDVRFTRPLKLPAKVRIFLDGDDFYVGQAPGGLALLTGRFGTHSAEKKGDIHE